MDMAFQGCGRRMCALSVALLSFCILCSTSGALLLQDEINAAGYHKATNAVEQHSAVEIEKQLHSSFRRKLQQDVTATGRFTSITIPLQMCGRATSMSDQALSSQVMNSPMSLQSFFSQCSYGAMTLNDNPQENLVLNRPVPVSRCDCALDETAQEAEDYVSNVLGIDMNQYSVKILVFPEGSCGFSGMARQGCFTNNPGPGTPGMLCRIWMNGLNSRGLIHEAGHSLGLGHANKGSQEAADCTSPMSNCPTFNCPNPYHSSLLGWTRPLQTLDINSFPAGGWQNIRLPARVTSSNNFIQLRGNGPDMFVSYTAPLGWEQGMTDGDRAYRLLVHTEKSASDWSRSQIKANLGSGERTDLSGSYPRWVLRLAPGPSMAGATAQVCRANNSGDCQPGSEPSGSGTASASWNRKKSPPPRKSKKKPPPRRG